VQVSASSSSLTPSLPSSSFDFTLLFQRTLNFQNISKSRSPCYVTTSHSSLGWMESQGGQVFGVTELYLPHFIRLEILHWYAPYMELSFICNAQEFSRNTCNNLFWFTCLFRSEQTVQGSKFGTLKTYSTLTHFQQNSVLSNSELIIFNSNTKTISNFITFNLLFLA
jgi:hypothetical protein